MDPTLKKHPKSAPFFSSTTYSSTKPHPTPPDPTVASSPTIQNISSHFSKLYTSHKSLASLKPSKSQPRIDTHFQAKAMSMSTTSDSSIASLIKSSHQHTRNVAEMEREGKRVTSTKVKEKTRKSLKDPHEEFDIKTATLSSKPEEIKKSHKKDREMNPSEEVLILPANEESGVKKSQEGYEMRRPSVSLAVNGGRRRSFCSSQTELADFFSCNGVKMVSVDMPPFMQIHAIDCARKTYDSLEKFTAKTLALTLKREFDGVYGPAWHCIVGTSFGSFVTHSVGGFLYFSMDHKLYVLLFKTTVLKAH